MKKIDYHIDKIVRRVLMEWIMVWVACGVFAAAVAASKGRSFIGWLFLGLFFGIFALLAAGFMPKAEEPVHIPQSIKPVERAERKCPFCAEMIKAEAIVCKHCGRDVEPFAHVEKLEQEKNIIDDAQEIKVVDGCLTNKEDNSGLKFFALFICSILFIFVVIFYSKQNNGDINNEKGPQNTSAIKQQIEPHTYEMPTSDEQKTELERKSNNGDKKATLTLAYALAYSDSIKEKNQGYSLFMRLADEGNEYAQYEYGRALYSGNTICQDKEKGVDYIKKAALSGHKPSIDFIAALNNIK